MKLRTVLTDAKKAVGALLAGEAVAVTAGLIDGHDAAVITGIGAAVTAGIVYLLNNTKNGA